MYVSDSIMVMLFFFEKITQKPLISNLDAGVVYQFLLVKNTFSNSFPQKSGFVFEPKNLP